MKKTKIEIGYLFNHFLKVVTFSSGTNTSIAGLGTRSTLYLRREYFDTSLMA
jgi:hypothetical protein